MYKKEKLILLESEDDEEEEDVGEIKVNESYAKSYNKFREKEVYQKLKDRYGDGGSGSSESSSSEEDDESPEFDEDFFKTLSMLKGKDDRIYDGKTEFFRMASSSSLSSKKPSAEKKVFLRDLERKVMLEKGGVFEEMKASPPKAGYYEELEEIKESFKEKTHENEEEEEESFLTKKTKTPQETQKEEEVYRVWLAGRKEELEGSEKVKDLKGLKDFWSRPDLDAGEKFLRDYILEKKYKENDEDEESVCNRIHDSDENLSEDEKTLKEMEEFETKFNFRFEEPDPDFIKRYPRTVEDSMRKKDDSRKRKRESVKERKEEAKNKKREELKQLKALKKKDILEKVKKLQEVAGQESIEFCEQDIEEDFDPDSYDKRMEEIFKNYDDNIVDEERPVFPDLGDSDIEEELEVENWDEWIPEDTNSEETPGVPEENERADGNSKETFQKEIVDSLWKKKAKRKSKFAQVIENKKPTFDPDTNKTFEKYLDEYYKLDYEDMIGDMPCRFKYRSVPKNSFGLDVNEILSAPDRELNAWSSLRKTCQYRKEEEEERDIMAYKNKGNNLSLKSKILPSLYVKNPEEELEAEQKKKSEKTRKRKKGQSSTTSNEIDLQNTEDNTQDSSTALSTSESRKKKGKNQKKLDDTTVSETNSSELSSKRKRKRKNNFKGEQSKSKKIDVNAEIQMSDKRLEAYGLKPGAYKRKIRKRKFNEKFKKC